MYVKVLDTKCRGYIVSKEILFHCFVSFVKTVFLLCMFVPKTHRYHITNREGGNDSGIINRLSNLYF